VQISFKKVIQKSFKELIAFLEGTDPVPSRILLTLPNARGFPVRISIACHA